MKKIDIRKEFSEFLQSKQFTEIPNVSIVPQNDPSLLFVNSGMFPLGPYLRGEVQPPSKRLFNIQRCVRFDDIEEVGDDRHTSFFHMIGDWSIGDFFKETQIPMMAEFIFEKLGVDPNKFYVTVFEGNDIAPRDDEAIKLWTQVFEKYGVKARVSDVKFIGKECLPELVEGDRWEIGEDKTERIFAYPMKKNWWQRGNAAGELGGPDSEMFYETDRKHDTKYGEVCHVNCDCGRFIEIGNNVFMQYILNENGGWDPLPQKNVDFGGGLERFLLAVSGQSDIFLTEEFYPVIEELEKLSGQKYTEENKKQFQIIADHMRGAVFIIADGVFPSNKDQGYILRRLLRRAIRASRKIGIETNFAKGIVEVIINMFSQYYPYLEERKTSIIEEVEKEEKKFINTISKGLKELERIIYTSQAVQLQSKEAKEISIVTPEQVFDLYQTYGFPVEMTLEEVKSVVKEKGLDFDEKEILKQVRDLIKHHQELSRSGAEQKFKGGLADTSEKTTAFHSTAHLFLEA
ncbi:MAG: alanine--tRNA ligase-related protein, partial [bacterium]